MTYRDDFYTPQNLIGYTGDINSPQTVSVYFESNTEFGHITQVHPEPHNVGRTRVWNKLLFEVGRGECTLYQYERGNQWVLFEDDDGAETEQFVFYERLEPRSGPTRGAMDANLFDHASRNTLQTNLAPADRVILEAAIPNCPDLKELDARQTDDDQFIHSRRFAIFMR